MRVEQVETVHELENRDDEREPELGRLGKDAVMVSVHELACRVGIEAEEAQLIAVPDELVERTDQLKEIGSASLRFPVEVMGVDANAHEWDYG